VKLSAYKRVAKTLESLALELVDLECALSV